MPNHVTHRLKVTGSKAQIDGFIERFCSPVDNTDGVCLDFSKVAPVPEVITNTESSSDSSLGYECLTGEPLPGLFRTSYLTYGWVKDLGITTHEELKAWAEKERPGAIKAGEACMAAIAETGHASWYEWNIANWGTKWNAYSASSTRKSDEEMELVFDTAWSPPEPIFRKIAELMPEIAISGYAFDEGWNFEAEITIKDGVAIQDDRPATAEVYEIVYGEPPETDEEGENEGGETA